MLFTSFGFIVFITIVVILYYAIPKRYQWMLLLLASYTFYSFAGLSNLIFIAATTVSTYFVSCKLTSLQEIQSNYLKENKLNKDEKKAYKALMKLRQRKWLLLCLIFNLGMLAVLKYTNFAIANINSILSMVNFNMQLSFLSLALPMGISFYTFQTMGYIIDVYRGKYPAEKNIFKLALFVSFFPQLVQGPISRFDDLSMTLFNEHDFDLKNISFGVQRILWGFFKKLVIADRILPAVNTIIKNPDVYQGAYVVVGMVFYAIELYADFTGGIDITIGIANVLGIDVKENFIRPYFSKSIVEYWRRWHISMGSWFKDYLFYPISVCKPMLNLSKSSRARFGDAIGKRIPVYLATIVVWFTTGIWHGASWNFIVWGVMNGLVIIVSQECEPFYIWFHKKFNMGHTLAFKLFQVVRTFFLMSSLRAFDCYRDVGTTFNMFGTIFTKFNINVLFDGSLMEIGLAKSDYFVLAIGTAILISVSLIQRKGGIRQRLWNKSPLVRYAALYILFIAILVLGAYGIGYNASQFIYNQF